MSEATIQSALQTLFQGMSEFDNADVVINDWRLLDGSIQAAPFVIIESTDEISSIQRNQYAATTYNIKVYLFEAFTFWKETLDNFTTRRDAILTLFNDSSTGNRAAGSVNGASVSIDIEEIRTASGIDPWYTHYVSPQDAANATPNYLWQLLIFRTRES